MNFAKRVFLIAGVYGLLILLPQYFLEAKTGRDYPPAITHPEYYYGFIGVTVAWQIVFLIISRDPVRYRLLMIPAILEKVVFVIPAAVLFGLGRLNATVFGVSLVDLILAVLFVIAYLRLKSSRAAID